MALPRARTAALLLVSFTGFSIFAVGLQLNISSLLNTSSSDAVNLSNLNNYSNNDDCFNPPTPRRGLYPAEEQDCLNAAHELYNVRDPFHPITFARRSNVGFKLPKVFRSGTCVISIDLLDDRESDKFRPIVVYLTAVDIAHRCTQGAFRLGGRTRAGPKQVVDVLVFGRVWPLENGTVEPGSAVVVAREWGDPSLPTLNETGLAVPNTTSLSESLGLNAPELGGVLDCADPPLPRERAWPISFADCEVATDATIGDRDRNQRYTFGRAPVVTNFYYYLPATFRYKTCVVHLDMNNNSDQDTVRLSIVEATAWVLAHKCSGEEKSADQYGGRATVGVAAQGLINVWVYGRIWPPPVGTSNMTSLALNQPTLLIDSE